jgi:hypothetical protein
LPLGLTIFLLDVVLIVHSAKTGRFWPWAYVIFFLPGIGGVAYIVAELAPEWLGSYKGRRARERFATTLNPMGRYRQLSDEIYVADTIASRSALAEECIDLGKYDEALAQYETILSRPMGGEPVFMLGKARAEFGLGQAGIAAATLEEIKRRWPDYHSPEGHLLYARALESAGRETEALEHYADVARYYPGAEPRARQAALLQRLGRTTESMAIAADVVTTLRRAPSHVQRSQREWFALAQRLTRA